MNKRNLPQVATAFTAIILLGLISAGAFVAFDDPNSSFVRESSASGPNMASIGDACSDHTGENDVGPATRPSVTIDISRHEDSVVTGDGVEEEHVYARFNITYQNTDALTKFTVLTTDRGSVVSTQGFSNVFENTYQAQQNAETASITYEYDITEMERGSGLLSYYATPDREIFTPVPQFRHGWIITDDGQTTPTCSYLFSDDVRRTITSSDETTVSKTSAFIGAGPHGMHKTTTGNTTITVVSPSTTNMNVDQRHQLGQLVATDRALDVNATVTDVTVFSINGGRDGGAAFGRSRASPRYQTVWVQQRSRVDALGSTWAHEYVHTHQDINPDTDMRWFTEASATYYANIIPYQCGDYEPGEFNTSLQTEMDLIAPPGSNSSVQEPYNQSVLAEPETWGTDANYHRGAVVLYMLDVKLRDATGGEHTLMDEFRWLNDQDESVSYVEFRRHVVSQSNEDVGTWLDKAVTTDAELNMTGVTPPETGPMNESTCSVQYTGHEYDDGEEEETPDPPDGNTQ